LSRQKKENFWSEPEKGGQRNRSEGGVFREKKTLVQGGGYGIKNPEKKRETDRKRVGGGLSKKKTTPLWRARTGRRRGGGLWERFKETPQFDEIAWGRSKNSHRKKMGLRARVEKTFQLS